jgi:hypothetical protein
MALTDKRKAYLAEWRKKNRESVRASRRKYESRPEVRAAKGEYYQRNKHLWRASSRRRTPEKRRREHLLWKERDVTGNGRRERFLRGKYGIGVADYNRMFAEQLGRCAICQCEPNRGKKTEHFDVDHDHGTGVVRGLLCRRCNALVGYVEKCGAEMIVKAHAYIRDRAVARLGAA